MYAIFQEKNQFLTGMFVLTEKSKISTNNLVTLNAVRSIYKLPPHKKIVSIFTAFVK